MAKRHSKHLRAPRPLLMGQEVRVGQSQKDYRCPGCNQPVRRGTAHVVVWPETPPLGHESGVEARRHWHTYCWERI